MSGTVVLLDTVRMLTDVSSESVSAALPLYLTAMLGLSPLAYGVVDGVQQGAGALVRVLGGWAADCTDRPKWVAFGGYAFSAVSHAALLPAQGLSVVSGVLTLDRLGKGLRTAPRDAVIVASCPPEGLGRAFGSMSDHTLPSVHDDAECPSVSPDGTTVVYKKRQGRAAGQWRLAALDLATGVETVLAETRAVDDQVEWPDRTTVVYGLPRAGSESAVTDVRRVPVDASSAPSVFIPQAWSPAIVR